MKHLAIATAAFLFSGSLFAQTDSTNNNNSDTVRVGNFIIIKKNKDGNTSSGNKSIWKDWDRNFDISIERRNRPKRNISTNWWIMDLGFTNFRDQTNYTYAQAGSYFRTFRPADGPVNQNSFKLSTAKSSNVNIWFFMQKVNVIKHVVNLKYGLGLEMYNFRYDSRISYRKDGGNPYVYNDSISFSKNKLYAGYLTVPFMINLNTSPNNRRGFSISAGMSAGYLISSRNKQKSSDRGKQKSPGDFNLEPFRVAAIGEVGLGPIRLYGSYSLNKLHKDITRVEQFPYAFGIRFSRW
ncbi:outer membrane beta-barrel protein [Sediminibacterium goheungense]|uniref:Outer membrane protein with beta-barrel domain n=1 Tax=Sediminibacterium goheungense TaxID=1086393 RepID=A0A4R6IV19_9BACT|nr:outer membrane beta-barrel protein [Sediminibacterium goheungense]TDO26452.1 outer membrane protein with beta-barrel domain [Sediminibacterium goheungense]